MQKSGSRVLVYGECSVFLFEFPVAIVYSGNLCRRGNLVLRLHDGPSLLNLVSSLSIQNPNQLIWRRRWLVGGERCCSTLQANGTMVTRRFTFSRSTGPVAKRGVSSKHWLPCTLLQPGTGNKLHVVHSNQFEPLIGLLQRESAVPTIRPVSKPTVDDL